MNKELEILFEELKTEGASEKEMEELIPVLNKLSAIKKHERPYLLKRKFLEEETPEIKKSSFLPKWFFAPAIAFSLLLLIGVTSVSYASQKTLPGDSLYPLKRLTENARILVDPGFKNKAIVRRSEEIKKLTEEKQEKPILINKAIDDFKKEVEDSEKHDADNVQESIENLKEAKRNVSEEEKRQIENVIKSAEYNRENGRKEIKSEENNKGEKDGERK